ncbi:acyltransferase domain-containing protein [Nonomuraea phyllanthi]|uniref:Acyltransferase domain-containing protein n=1 Tax=Nonomuraea phyllanthi TaxID=2219224 RepID=A0A5C4W018_9ACTN|nr:type I polyketide synthase [Nonomuraea phyllanthi]KAB8190930.1 acyltransferase domain-containing protein [Nonomuraea phyllanthi]
MGTEEKLRVYLKRVTVELAQARKRLTELEERSHEPIAVVGMACRYPGGGTVEDFWDLLRRGDSAVREVPPARWDIDAYYNPEPGVPGGMYTRYGAFLDDVTGWDAEFFGLSPREALRMDPHQRLLLELAWEGLENAGLSPSRVAGSRTGVMVGFMDTLQYGRLQIERQGDEAASDPYLGQGAVPSIAAGRIAYQLDLTGPTVTVDTACSSSLIAIHLAAESLRRGECDLALAGGASLTLHPTVYLQACAGLMMCSDGRCKTFDERADGYVMGEGGGMLVLEPLSRALANGRRIRAVLRGSAVNQDGRSNGLTAPSRRAQTDVITRALAAARVAPDEIDYVEAHGSGTHLGDAIELSALHDVFGGRPAERPLRVGAVKTNIGHTQAAAGVAGVIKTILILENGLIPPSLNLSTPAAAIPEDGTVQPVTAELPLPSREGPRLAGVSSFGLSGTNAHVILEAAPTPHPLPPTGDLLTTTPELAASIETASIETAPIETAPIETAPIETVTVAAEAPKKEAVPGGSADHTAAVRGQVVPVSAASDAALREQATRLADWLDERPGTSLDDLTHTLQTGRAELDHRRALVCADLGEAVRRLRDIAGNGGGHRVKGRPRIAFLLPGVGDQYAGLGSELYTREPVYAEAVDQCVDLVRRHSGLDLRPFFTAAGPAAGSAAGSVQGRPDSLAALLGRGGDAPAPADDPLDHAATAHPFLFTVEYALARLLRHRGITPDLLIGYSLGEYVAACLAGVFTLEDALHVVIERAHLITAVPAGRMVAVAAPDDRVRAALSASGVEVDVAARNGPAMTVLSGPPAEIEAATAVLMGEGLACRPLRSAHAFHSALLEPAREKLVAVLETVRRQAPAVTIVSNLTGEPLTAEQATSTSYWADQLVSTVRFADGVRHCLGQDVTAFVELGPGQTLGGLVRQNLAGGSAAVLGTLPPYWTAGQPRDAHAELLASCAALWELGVGVSWERTRPAGGRVLSLPTYPFQRTRFWPENGELTGAAHGELTGAAHGGQAGVAHGGQTDVADAGRPEAGDAGEPGDFTFVPGWRRDPVSGALPTALALPGPLVVLADPEGVGSALADLADASGTPVVEVVAAPGSEARREGRRLTIDPAVPEHYAEAFAQLPPGTVHVAHLWSLASSPGMPDDGELQEALSNGFHSLMLAVQALGERPGRLLTVSRGATEIIGGDVPAPHQSLAHGLGRAARHEYAELAWSGVDLDAEAGHPATTTAAQLAHELLSRPEEDTTPEAPDPVAGWRRGRRWVRGWTEVPAPPEAAGVWRPDGAYLITGGTRGLGMALAKHLTRAGVRRLALVARTPLPRTATEHAPTATGHAPTATGHAPTGAEHASSATGHAPTGAPHDEGQEQDGAGLLSRDAAGSGEEGPLPGDGAGADEARVAGMLRDVAELEAAGAEVLLLTADTGVPDQLRAALRRAREHFGGLHGVIHAAGLPAGGMLRRRTPDEAARVLAPKVLAMGPLAELVGAGTPPEERPEVLVLYSSAVTAYGGVGEADYCAANTVLDAYGQALAATAPTTRVVSVAWGPWRHDVWQAENLKSSGGGLAGRVADYRARYGFADDAGCALLDRIVAGGHGGVLAVRQPLREVLRAWTSMLDLDDLVGAAVPQGQRFPRPLLRTDYVAPRTEAEAGIAELWGAYLGIDRVGVHDPFFDLGGNSLLGMAMVLALEKQLGRPVPPALLFEHPTVAEFAAAIDGGADPREALTTSSARGQRRRRARSSNRK